MATYKLLSGNHGRYEADGVKVYSSANGDTLELSEHEAAALGNRVVRISAIEPSTSLTANQVDSIAEIAATGEEVQVATFPADSTPAESTESAPAPASTPASAEPIAAEPASTLSEQPQEAQGEPAAGNEVPSGEELAASGVSDAPNPWSEYLAASNVPEVLKTIAKLETVDDLELVKQGELQGKNRSTILNTLESRLASLPASIEETLPE